MENRGSTRRVEALLQAAERGSTDHITRLGKEWPEDIASAKRALLVLVKNFETHVEFIPALKTRQLSERDADRITILMKSCLSGFEGFLNRTRRKDDWTEQLFAILRPYLDSYLAWLVFVEGLTGVAGAQVSSLLLSGIHHTTDIATQERVVDFSLFLWKDEAATSPLQRETIRTPSEYEAVVSRKYDPLLECMAHEPTRQLFIEKINSCDEASLKMLARSLYTECFRWSSFYKRLYQQHPTSFNCTRVCSYVETAVLFCEKCPRFFRIILKMRFATQALKIASKVPDIKSQAPKGGSVAVEIASLLFGPRTIRKMEMAQLAEELLNAGLLNIIAFSLLFPRSAGNGTPFDTWDSGTDGDPLHSLIRLAHHPRVTGALQSAITSLSDEVQAMLDEDKDYGKPFLRAFWFYDFALQNLQNPGSYDLCDSVEHLESLNLEDDDKHMKACSGCHTTVYCSRECQRSDWEAFHKAECLQNRERRIYEKLYGPRIFSYRARKFKLLYLQLLLEYRLFLNNGVRGDPVLRAELLKDRAYFFNCDMIQVEFFALKSDANGSLVEHEGSLYGDARSRKMIQRSREDVSVIYAGFSAISGRHLINTYGNFRIVEGGFGSGGTLAGANSLVLLDGFVTEASRWTSKGIYTLPPPPTFVDE
ncbi:hypothetical protein DFP72DRAFT_1046564 [Ephemerocybe angulata]|uniref:MYND-type domain-containing protein n=1 Tax=Ephemerocybe angulata TaxID=980116 RepID=A0A8H6M5Z7_9AGAR|nr:hypothetical protein DFP72DRAFT_1046564 [Tulosesus angulatus]